MSLWSDELSLLDEVCRDAALLGSGAALGVFKVSSLVASPRNRAGESGNGAQAGQTGVTTYGGRVGLNYMIN
jgi:hypothetical protein